MTDPMREAFEREVLQKRGWKNDYTVTDGVFKYTHHQVQQAYEVWQAALSQPRMTEWDECPDCNGSGFGVRSVSCLEKCDGACGGLGKIIRQIDGTLSYIARQAELNHPDFNRVAKMNAEQARALLAKLPAQQNTAPLDGGIMQGGEASALPLSSPASGMELQNKSEGGVSVKKGDK